MTVRELMQKLVTMPQDAVVCVDCHGGAERAVKVELFEYTISNYKEVHITPED